MNKKAMKEAMDYFGVNDVDELIAVLEEQNYDGRCETTDGCVVEPDGYCPHGEPSWLVKLGLI